MTVKSSGPGAPRLIHSLYDRKVKVGDRLVLAVKGQWSLWRMSVVVTLFRVEVYWEGGGGIQYGRAAKLAAAREEGTYIHSCTIIRPVYRSYLFYCGLQFNMETFPPFHPFQNVSSDRDFWNWFQEFECLFASHEMIKKYVGRRRPMCRLHSSPSKMLFSGSILI